MDNENDFLDGAFPAEPEAAPVELVAEQPTEPVAEPVADAAPAAPEPKAEPGHVPLTALLDEREKRKDLERKLAELERNRVETVSVPNPAADPVGYQQHLLAQTQQMVMDTRLNMSEVAARRHYGEDVTEAAKAWALEKFGTNPSFQAEVLSQPDPYDHAIRAFQRDQIASQVSQVSPDDFQQFQAWKTAQAQIAAATTAAPTPSAPVPRSIASAPSAGGVAHVPIDDEAIFAGGIP